MIENRRTRGEKRRKPERRSLILDTLGERQLTVSELMEELLRAGKIPDFSRNYVAPRLTELKAAGIVRMTGRRRATRSGATEAVWERVEKPERRQ